DPRLCPYPETGSSTLGGAEDGRTRLYGWHLFGIFPLGLEEGGHAIRPNPHDCQREKRVALGWLQRKLVVGEHGLPAAAPLSVNPVDSLVAYPGTSLTILPRRTAGPPPERITRVVLSQACAGDTVVVRWRDLHPGRLVPADGPVLRIERLAGERWDVVAWDDDRELEIRAVRSLGGRGYVWEAR